MIGVFDSGVGGLTVLQALRKEFPDQSFRYLGDNARAPYGDRSAEEIYAFTKEAVFFLFEEGCELVVLACNTASAYALRRIQTEEADFFAKTGKRVLGIIRPTEEFFAQEGFFHVGVLATAATVHSQAYQKESQHIPKNISIEMQACPLWVPYIERGEDITPEWRKQIRRDLKQIFEKQPQMDALLLGCTHYPAVIDLIKEELPRQVPIITQGMITALSLKQYLERHPNMEKRLEKTGKVFFQTTGDVTEVNRIAEQLLKEKVSFEQVALS